MTTPITSQQDLNTWIARAETQLSEATNATERLKALEVLAPQLRQGLDELRTASAERERAQNVPHGTDADVTRAYTMASANREDIPGAVANPAKGILVDGGANRNHIGSGAGVVRLLGGVDEGGFYEHGLLDDPHPKSEWQHELQKRMETLAWVKAVKGPRADTRGILRSIHRHIGKGPESVRKVFADNPGEGGEFIVSIPLTELERTAELGRQVEALIPTMNITGSTATHPFLTTGVQPFIHGQPVTGDLNPGELPKSVPITGERNIAMRTMTVALPVDLDALEDSIVDFSALGSQLVGEAVRDGYEDALVNADNAVTHGDTGFATWNPRSRWQVTGSSIDHRRGFIGFRQRAYDVDGSVGTAVSDYSGQQTVADYIGALAGLSSPHGFGDVVYITSPEHFLAKIIRDTNLLTVDKYGASATVVTGEVGRIGGRRLILSEFVTPDLQTTGLYTGAGNSTTGMLLVNLSRFRMVLRRSLRIQIESQVIRHTAFVIASVRKTLHTFDGNSVANVRWLHNLAIS